MPAFKLSYTTLFWMLTSLHRLDAIIPWSPVVVVSVDVRVVVVAVVSAAVIVGRLLSGLAMVAVRYGRVDCVYIVVVVAVDVLVT